MSGSEEREGDEREGELKAVRARVICESSLAIGEGAGTTGREEGVDVGEMESPC
jgi:hypothetical protein